MTREPRLAIAPASVPPTGRLRPSTPVRAPVQGRLSGWASALALLSAIAGSPLAAQLPDLPLHHEPIRSERVRWIVALHAGRGLSDASGEHWSWALAGSRRFGPRATLGIAAGLRYPEAVPSGHEAHAQGAARLDVRLNPGRHDVTWSLVAGVGYGRGPAGTGVWEAPFGLGVAYYARKGPGPMLKLWIVPRHSLRIVDVGVESVRRHGLGASGGVTFGFEEGFGITAAAEWMHLFRRTAGTVMLSEARPVTASLTFRWHRR